MPQPHAHQWKVLPELSGCPNCPTSRLSEGSTDCRAVARGRGTSNRALTPYSDILHRILFFFTFSSGRSSLRGKYRFVTIVFHRTQSIIWDALNRDANCWMEQWSTHNSHEVHNVHWLPNASTQSLISQIMEGQGRGNPRERNHFEAVWAGTETEQHPNSQRYPAHKYEFKYKQKQMFFL